MRRVTALVLELINNVMPNYNEFERSEEFRRFQILISKYLHATLHIIIHIFIKYVHLFY